MQDLNESQEQSHAPDFNAELREAQQTGDYEFVMETAKKSKKMLVDFRDAIRMAQFSGKDTTAVGMGLNFLDNMIASSDGQINALKNAERQTKEALKRAMKNKGAPTEVVGPETPPETPAQPQDVPPEPQAPVESPETPPEAPNA